VIAMPEPIHEGWPDYLPGPRDDILALGVVSLNYGHLENIFRVMFAMVTGMSENQVRALFERINNDARQKILEQLLDPQPFPDGLKKLIAHFLEGYTICAKNRHSIMHSHSGGIHSGTRGTQGIVLSKYSRSGGRFVCFAHAAKLRTIADAIDAQSTFGTEVILAVSSFRLCQRQNRIHDFGRGPLPETPPLPTELDWLFQPESQTDPRPPGASQA